MLGIALGITALITVLSVMNGFEKEIKAKILGAIPHITLFKESGLIPNWQILAQKLKTSYPEILTITPFLGGQGLLTYEGRIQGTQVQGIDPHHTALQDDALKTLQSGAFNILIGAEAASNLGLQVGDKVNLVLPEPAMTVVGIIPRFKRFQVSGILSGESEFERAVVYSHIEDATRLFYRGAEYQQTAGGLHLRLKSLYAAPRMDDAIQNEWQNFQVSNWTETYGNYFEAIKLEKTIMFLMLLLIVAVAAFNLVSSLVMVVTDKTAEIAILRTLGATPGFIMRIFMIQGGLIGFLGMCLGIIGGIALALNVTELVNALEHLFKVQFLSRDVYFISFLPSDLEWRDVIKISVISLVMSFLATLYPAWRAARIQPAEALRYE